MDYTEVVRRRRMVRNYDPDRPVPREVLTELLELAIRAPSAGFSQGWHFLVLDEAEDRAAFWQATTDSTADPDPWLRDMQTAPALIIAMSDKQAYLDRYAAPDKGWTDRDEAHWPVPYWDIDTGMASLLILLGAVDRGLASCFFGVPAERHQQVKQAFGIPDRLSLVGVISLGQPAPDRRSPSLKRSRRPVSEVASFGRMQPPAGD
ncbi:nitroreductase family protein [Jatrophihabitans sp.]|uniref:nitroreductase family protein n=1 Tax=Jatrophihabitans sp. TaxID=1932789 RepID=UPI002BB46932|nr:nitroreductase family protein [Jatrophihabitans sp.]